MVRHSVMSNTVINIANTAVSFIIAYVMTPVILNRMGTEAYGIWVFLGIFSVSGYFSLLDFGFGGATIKYIAEYEGTNDREKLQGVVNATLFFFLAAGILGGLLLYLFNAFFFTAVFHIPQHQQTLVSLLVNVIALSFLYQFPALAFSSIIEGLQRYDYLRGVSLMTTIVSNVVIFLFLKSSGGLEFMIATTLIASFAVTALYALVAKLLLPDIHIRLALVKRETFTSLVSLSSKLFASKIVGLVFNNTDKILIGIFLTVTSQTDYDIVNKLHIILLSLLSMFNQAVLPATSEYAAKNDGSSLRLLLLRMTKYSAAAIVPAYLLMMIFAQQILGVWVGAEFARLAPLVQLYCSHFAITMLVGVSSTMLIGVNRVEKALYVSVWAAALNLAISVFTIRFFGIAGLMLGTAVAYAISSVMYIVITNKVFNIGQAAFFKSSVWPLLPATVVTASALFFLRPLMHFTKAVPWLAVAILAYAIFMLVFSFSGMNREERRSLLSSIRKTGTRPDPTAP